MGGGGGGGEGAKQELSENNRKRKPPKHTHNQHERVAKKEKLKGNFDLDLSQASFLRFTICCVLPRLALLLLVLCPFPNLAAAAAAAAAAAIIMFLLSHLKYLHTPSKTKTR